MRVAVDRSAVHTAWPDQELSIAEPIARRVRMVLSSVERMENLRLRTQRFIVPPIADTGCQALQSINQPASAAFTTWMNSSAFRLGPDRPNTFEETERAREKSFSQ